MNILKRFTEHVTSMKRDKEDKILGWRTIGETNFFKSLDHRSFFFKKAQRDCLIPKNMFEELKSIHRTPIHLKTDNQLKGGSDANHEFFSTYTSFNIKHIQAYRDDVLEAADLVDDYPINLRDPKLLNNPRALPHMRFLMNDKEILSLTFKILIRVPRENNTTAADKIKIDEQLELLINKFFKLNKTFK